MSKAFMKITPAIVFVAASLAWYGCGASKEPRQAEADTRTAPVAVQAVTVQPAEWPSVYEASGTVRARTSAVISSKVMGYVREVRAQVGDRVRQGQPLVVLDSRDLDAAYKQAVAANKEAKDALPEAENGIAAAKAQLELAQATFRRMQDLFKKDSISNQEFDEATAKLKVAQAAYEMALAKRTQLVSKIAQTEQAVESAGIVRGYAEIVSPFSGTVTEKTVDVGNLATPGAPLLTIERDGSYRLEAAVEESKLTAVRLNQQVTVVLDALGRTVQGRVSEIVPAVDASSRAFIVKIDLPEIAGLKSGIFGRARFLMGREQVIAVPAAAVAQRGQLSTVLVAENGRAQSRLVTLGGHSDGNVQVLSGLNPGDKVIFPVPENVSDGARVEVRQ
jgi:RND family efflux transporter MFP subunit